MYITRIITHFIIIKICRTCKPKPLNVHEIPCKILHTFRLRGFWIETSEIILQSYETWQIKVLCQYHQREFK